MKKFIKMMLLAGILGAYMSPYQNVDAAKKLFQKNDKGIDQEDQEDQKAQKKNKKGSLFQSLKDKVKGQKSNEQIAEIDKFISSLESFNKKLTTIADQTAKLQKDTLPKDADFSMLMPIYCWAATSEQLLSVLKVRINELRDQYATIEGAQSRKDKQEGKKKQTTRTGKAIDKEETKIEAAKEKIRQIIEHILLDKGMQGTIANVKCSTTVMLQVMESSTKPPLTHNNVLKNIISSAERYNDVFVTFKDQMESFFSTCREISEYKKEGDENIDERIPQWIRDVTIVNDALELVHQYYGGEPSNEEIEVMDIQSLKEECALKGESDNSSSKSANKTTSEKSKKKKKKKSKKTNQPAADAAENPATEAENENGTDSDVQPIGSDE